MHVKKEEQEKERIWICRERSEGCEGGERIDKDMQRDKKNMKDLKDKVEGKRGEGRGRKGAKDGNLNIEVRRI